LPHRTNGQSPLSPAASSGTRRAKNRRQGGHDEDENDGVIDEDEFVSSTTIWYPKGTLMRFVDWDSNADGQLDAKAFAEGVKKSKMFLMYDTNDNGVVAVNEFHTAIKTTT
jgi:Ca2+-binding EF-hand superfamily protein